MSFNNNVRENLDKNIVAVVTEICNDVNVIQPVTTVIEIFTGPKGNTGASSSIAGPSGSSAPFTYVTGSTWATTSSITISGSLRVTGSLFVDGAIRMTQSSSLTLPLTSSSNPSLVFTGSIYYSGSFIFVWNGSRYMSASLA